MFQDAHMLKIEVNTMKHAFRVNGVTFSRKKLGELFPAWGDKEETLYRYLVIVPFLAETKEVDDAATSNGRYAIAKAKRIYAALALPEAAATVAFMMATAQMGNLPIERMGDIATALHDHICNCGVKKSHEIKPEHDGRTLH